jgi:hypothetical protein
MVGGRRGRSKQRDLKDQGDGGLVYSKGKPGAIWIPVGYHYMDHNNEQSDFHLFFCRMLGCGILVR